MLYEYRGFPEFVENKTVMSALLSGKEIKVKGSGFESLIYQDRTEGWNYVETQNEINEFLNQVFRFS